MMCDLALTNVGVFSAQEILEINLDCEISCVESLPVHRFLEQNAYFENYLP